MIVGRGIVLDACGDALAEAMAGRGRLVLLGGEAGIGKSTIVRELADSGARDGAVVRWGASWQGGSLLPFGPWLEALRHPGHDACARSVAALEPGDDPSSSDADTAARARVRFFAGVVDAIRSAADDHPQVIVLEDLHWADAGSLDLLRALTPHLPAVPVLTLVTYRTEEAPAGGALGGQGGGAEQLILGGLREDETAALLAEILGHPPTVEEAALVHRNTGGNPLFVTQVGRLMASGSTTTLPAGVRDVLGRRLARLATSCDRVLGAAAVLGTEFAASEVAAVLDDDLDAAIGELDVAAPAGLVEPDRTDPDRWMFVHDLVRVTRYENLPAATRLDLHRTVVDVLERTGATAGVLAHHAARARFDADDPRPAALAVSASHEALQQLAWAEAAELSQRALDHAPGGDAGEEVRAEAWLALGDARLRGGDSAGAADAFAAAAQIGRWTDRAELIARAALGFGAGLGGFEVRVLDRRQIDILEEAAAALPDDSSLRPMVLARLSVALSFVGSIERRLQLADEAVALARTLGHDRSLAAALGARCDAIAGPRHVADRLAASAEIIVLGQRSRHHGLELLGRRLRVVALLEGRHLAAFDAEVAAFARTAERLGDPFYGWWAPFWRAARAHADGDLDGAAALRAIALDTGRAGASANAELLSIVADGLVAADRMDQAAVDRAWDAMVTDHPEIILQDIPAAALAAYLAARLGQVDAARAQLVAVGPGAVDEIPEDQEWLPIVSELLVAGVVAGDDDVVRWTYELLVPFAGLGVFDGAAAHDHGVVDRYLALAAGHLGDVEAARRHVDDALLANAVSGRLVMALTRADAARALLAGGDADRDRAGKLAHAAADELDAIGLSRQAEEVRALLADTVGPSNGSSTSAAAGAATGGARPGVAPAGLDSNSDDGGSALVREGDAWAFTYDGTTVRVKHAKGVADLAVLLASPGVDVHVRTLAGVDHLELPSSPQAALDDTALDEYRRRLADVEADLQEADDHHDVARAERLRAERDALVDEITKAYGLGGRSRGAGSDPDERLRKAVSARVKASVERIERLHPALGAHLRNSVTTGFRCAYRPEKPTGWRISTDRPA